MYLPLLFFSTKFIYQVTLNKNRIFIYFGYCILLCFIIVDIKQSLAVPYKASYDRAYEWMQQHQQAEDQVMFSEIIYCYFHQLQCDYILVDVQHPLINLFFKGLDTISFNKTWLSQEQVLGNLLAKEKTIWFIVHQRYLDRQFGSNFTQQIFGQMNLIQRIDDDILIFQSLPQRVSLPAKPTQIVNEWWANGTKLVGFRPEFKKEQLILTLFWQSIPLADNYKIFIHFRSVEGETLLQADHTPFEHIPYDIRILMVKEAALIRDQIIIPIPDQLDLPDQAIVGIYETETGTRSPLNNDLSGEQGLWLSWAEP